MLNAYFQYGPDPLTNLSLKLVLFISALDQTIVSTAIPSMAKDLNSAAGYTWIGAAYLLSMCAANPMWVRISDIWGRKAAVLGAIIVFSVGSIIAAAAIDMRMLIAGRGVQGLAGGGDPLVGQYNHFRSLQHAASRAEYQRHCASLGPRRDDRARYRRGVVAVCVVALVSLDQPPRLWPLFPHPRAVPGLAQSTYKASRGPQGH